MDNATPEEKLRRSIGARIARLRAERDVTQEQLAERVDAAPQTIRRIEKGHNTPPLGRLLDIAGALGVDLMVLFEDADAAVPPPTWDTRQAEVVELYDRTPDALKALLIEVMERFAAPR